MSALVKLKSDDLDDREKVNCDLCNKDDSQLFCTKPIPGLQSPLRFTQCRYCGFIYLNPRPSFASLNKLYASSQYFQGKGEAIGYFDYIGEKNFKLKTAHAKLKKIEKKLGRKGRLLEIGCAAGFFIAAAKERGWEVVGIDISKPMIDYAASQLGLEAYATRFEDIDIQTHPAIRPASFDVIAVWGTTGTFITPCDNFKKIHELLKDDGLLVFNATNSKSLIAKLMGKRWFPLQPSSAFVYNRMILFDILKKSGFKINKMAIDKHHVTLYKMVTQRQVAAGAIMDKIAQKIESFGPAHKTFPIPNFGFLECYASKS